MDLCKAEAGSLSSDSLRWRLDRLLCTPCSAVRQQNAEAERAKAGIPASNSSFIKMCASGPSLNAWQLCLYNCTIWIMIPDNDCGQW